MHSLQSTVKQFGDCALDQGTLCLKFKKASQSNLQFGANHLEIIANYKLESHKSSMVEEFDRIFKRFLLEQLEKEHRPFEELSLNFVFLTPTGLPRSTRLELASKPMALIKNRLEIEKIFKKVLKPTGPINIETSIRYDYFSDGQYYDKEAFDLYDNLTGFWRVKSTFVRNINLLIPVKTSRDVNVYEYRDNYVFELSQNGDLETLLQRLKIVALKQSSVNRLISFFKDTSITGKIETSSVFKISGRIRRWRALREAQYFIKSIKYAINNINLQIKQEYLEEFKYVLNRLVEGVHDINHLVEDEEFMIRFYKYNRETIYDSTYIYGEYR